MEVTSLGRHPKYLRGIQRGNDSTDTGSFTGGGIMAYTRDDLKKAQAELRRELERWDNYSGNNPNKFQASLQSLRSQVDIIKAELIRTGIVETPESGPKSEKQLR